MKIHIGKNVRKLNNHLWLDLAIGVYISPHGWIISLLFFHILFDRHPLEEDKEL